MIGKCKYCQKTFEIYPPAKVKDGRGIFCSRKCKDLAYSIEKKGRGIGTDNKNWRGGKTKRICEYCGKEFLAYLDKGHTGRFCNRKCLFLATKKFDTDIEKIIEAWLTIHNISFNKQKRIGRYDVPDFFIEPNICIYCDGDYWHTKKEARERDERINNRLKRLGYFVIRLLGSEIKNWKSPNRQHDLPTIKEMSGLVKDMYEGKTLKEYLGYIRND